MITDTEVKKIAQLARINLSGTEIETLSKDLENILNYIAQLQTLDVKDIKPTTHVLPISNVFREDEVTSCFSQNQALSIAIAKLNGFFKVPQIID